MASQPAAPSQDLPPPSQVVLTPSQVIPSQVVHTTSQVVPIPSQVVHTTSQVVPTPSQVIPTPSQVVLVPVQHASPQPRNLKAIRNLALTQLTIGTLTLILGCATFSLYRQWGVNARAGLWSGGWIVITGSLGIYSTRKKNILNCAYLVVNILASCICVISAFFITMAIMHYASFGNCSEYYFSRWCNEKGVGLGLHVPMMILMVIGFMASIAASVYCCQKGCCYTTPPMEVYFQQQPLLFPGQSTVVSNMNPPVYPQQQQQILSYSGGHQQYGLTHAPMYVIQSVPQYHGVQVPPPHRVQVPPHGVQVPLYGMQLPQHENQPFPGTPAVYEQPPVYSDKPPY